MSTKPPFRFQQFTVCDDRAAMKVGTDGVLLGAWTPIRDAKRILDVGTGCGLIALMLAQRTIELESKISAIEIDQQAAGQALENFEASPWQNRLPESNDEVHCSLEQFSQTNTASEQKFDLAVCNPPFFERAYPSPDLSRRTARQTEDLSRESLFQNVQNLLTDTGRFCVVLPFEQADSTIQTARNRSLHLWHRTNVRPTPTSELKRVLLEFGPELKEDPMAATELVIEIARHKYSTEYADLTKNFHLRYAIQDHFVPTGNASFP